MSQASTTTDSSLELSLFSNSSTVSSQSTITHASEEELSNMSSQEFNKAREPQRNQRTANTSARVQTVDSIKEKRVGCGTKAGMAFSILAELIDECSFEVLLDVHRERKMAVSICQICHNKCRDHCTKSNYDIFGMPYYTPSTLPHFECVNCHKMLAAAKYAPHLEKCLGLAGRASSRVAQRRIGSSSPYTTAANGNGEESGASDADGGYGEKKRKKNTNGKNPPLKRSLTPDPTHLSPRHATTPKKSPLRKGVEMQRSHSMPSSSGSPSRAPRKRPPGEALSGGKRPPAFSLQSRSGGKERGREGSTNDFIDIDDDDDDDDSTIEVQRSTSNRVS